MESEKCPNCGFATFAVNCKEAYESFQKEEDSIIKQYGIAFYGPPCGENPLNFKIAFYLFVSFGVLAWLFSRNLYITIFVSIFVFIFICFSEYISRIIKNQRLDIRQEYKENLERWNRSNFCSQCAIFFAKKGDIFQIKGIMGNEYEMKSKEI